MILIYAFSNRWGTNISRRVLSELQKILPNENISFLPVFFFPQPFYHKYIEFNQYSLIIGLGDGQRNLSKIKIETQTQNAYNNKEIYSYSPIYLKIRSPDIDKYDSSLFFLSSNMGTHNCNWIAYKTQLNINQKNLNTKHLFLHLPSNNNAGVLALQIGNLLDINKMLK